MVIAGAAGKFFSRIFVATRGCWSTTAPSRVGAVPLWGREGSEGFIQGFSGPWIGQNIGLHRKCVSDARRKIAMQIDRPTVSNNEPLRLGANRAPTHHTALSCGTLGAYWHGAP